MIYLTIGDAAHFLSCHSESPAEVNLLIMGKETTVESSLLPVVSRTDHQTGSRGPQHLGTHIILSVVIFHRVKDASPAERITKFVDEATAGPCILKGILVCHRQQFRLTGCHLRMIVHELNEWCQPVMSHFHITVQQHVIGSLHLLQCLVIPFGKTPVLLQLDDLHLGEMLFQERHRLIRRGINLKNKKNKIRFK